MSTEKTPLNESKSVIPSIPDAMPCPRCEHARPLVDRREDGSVRIRCASIECTHQLVVYPEDLEPLLDAAARLFVVKLWNGRGYCPPGMEARRE